MPRRYDLIVFDWDGTLMDSEVKIVRCIRAAAADLGVVDPGAAAARRIIGLGLTEAMAALFPQADDNLRGHLTERYRTHFLELDQTETPLFPGVAEGLERLAAQGHRLAVATGKARRGLERVLGETGLGPLFVASRCADETRSKPDPRMLQELLAETGVDPGRALMVGDTTYDMRMACAAGVPGLGVVYGVHDRQELLQQGALACVASFPEVCAWIR